MRSTIHPRRITRAVADGTGRTEEEVWVWVAVTATGAAVVGLLKAVDAVLRLVDDLDAW